MITKLFWLAAAGALGTISRFALLETVQRIWPHNWPVGVLLVNTLGCFMAGVILSGSVGGLILRPAFSTLVMAGFMGAFTTYSAFVVESGVILREAGWHWAVVYVSTHILLGAAAYGLGLWAFR